MPAKEKKPAKEKAVIGIDLGSSYSCVGVFSNEKVEVIANEQGNRYTPSCISFDATEQLVGDAAMGQIHKNAKNSIYGMKALLGADMNDPDTQKFIAEKKWPFRVTAGEGGEPVITVQFQEKEKQLSAVQLVASMLTYLKETAAKYTGKEVGGATITVPASFNEKQRAALLEASKLAGLDVTAILSEPVAAAIAFGLDKVVNEDEDEDEDDEDDDDDDSSDEDEDADGVDEETDGASTVLVFDFGGTSLDVSVLNSYQGLFHIVNTVSEPIGGEMIDQCLQEHFAKEFKRKHRCDMTDSVKAMRKLQTACEQTKQVLSKAAQASVALDGLFEGLDFNSKISRARFEALIAKVTSTAMDTVRKALNDANLTADSIDRVLLVGGTSRIPKVQAQLGSLLGSEKLETSVNPDDAFALGATIQCMEMSQVEGLAELPQVTEAAVVPLTLGIAAADGTFIRLIERGSILPAEASVVCSTAEDSQSAVYLTVYEGERGMAADNTTLLQAAVGGIAAMPRGVPQVEVTLEVDVDGNVSVTASIDGNTTDLSIKADPARLSGTDVQDIVVDAAKHYAADQNKLEAAEAGAALGAFVANAVVLATDASFKKQLEAAQEWLQSDGASDAAVIKAKQTELEGAQSALLLASMEAVSTDAVDVEMDDDDDMD